jgi:hypothetical protein
MNRSRGQNSAKIFFYQLPNIPNDVAPGENTTISACALAVIYRRNGNEGAGKEGATAA